MEEAEVDIYRDTIVRYLGYSNELGESFRPMIPVQWSTNSQPAQTREFGIRRILFFKFAKKKKKTESWEFGEFMQRTGWRCSMFLDPILFASGFIGRFAFSL